LHGIAFVFNRYQSLALIIRRNPTAMLPQLGRSHFQACEAAIPHEFSRRDYGEALRQPGLNGRNSSAFTAASKPLPIRTVATVLPTLHDPLVEVQPYVHVPQTRRLYLQPLLPQHPGAPLLVPQKLAFNSC
jgi:hypothetical protein